MRGQSKGVGASAERCRRYFRLSLGSIALSRSKPVANFWDQSDVKTPEAAPIVLFLGKIFLSLLPSLGAVVSYDDKLQSVALPVHC